MKELYNKYKGIIKELYNKHKEMINYIIIGGLTTIISLIVYNGLTLTILNPDNGIELQIANILSWVVAVTFAYFTNRKYVFTVKDKANLKEATSFYLSRVVTLLIDMLLMYILVTVLKFNDKIMKVLVQIIVIILNYIFSKFFVFKKKKA